MRLAFQWAEVKAKQRGGVHTHRPMVYGTWYKDTSLIELNTKHRYAYYTHIYIVVGKDTAIQLIQEETHSW